MISLVTNCYRQAVHLSFVAFYSRKINKKKSIILSHFSTLKFLFGPKKPTKTYYKELCRVSCTFPAINNAYLTAFHANVSIRFFLRCFYTLHARYRNDTNFISFQSQLMTNGWSLLTWSEQNRSPNVWMLSSSPAWHSRRQSTFAFFSWLQAFDHQKMVSDG